MIRNTFLNSNPYDEIDNQIKYRFSKNFGLCLNKLNYNLFGIVDDCFLTCLIGESELFHVYLGYKNGFFLSVKVMKRYKFDSKEDICCRIELFEKEINLRFKLQSQEVSKYLVSIHNINFHKYIIYEELCSNATLEEYLDFNMSEKLIRTLFLNILIALKQINVGSRLYHATISPKDIMFDENFNFKLIGIRNLTFSIFSSEIYYSNFSTVNEDEQQQVKMLIIILCKMLFKEDYTEILVFLNTDLNIIDIRHEKQVSDLMLFDSKYCSENSCVYFSEHDSNNKDINTYSNNMKYLENTLESLIKKRQLISSTSLKEFIIKLINDKTLEDIEFTSWFNDEIMNSQDYYYEMNNFRTKALIKRFEYLSVIEKHLINVKSGIFKVIKKD